MAFNRPTLADISGRIASDVEAELPGTDARLRRSNLGVISRVLAAAVHGLYGYLAYVARQVIVDSADGEHLERWAALRGIERKGGVFSSGLCGVTGATGAVVPVGASLRRADGAEYTVTAGATLVAGAATLTVRAKVAGVAGNCAPGTKLSFVSPIGSVSSTAVVGVAGLVDGADGEQDEALRARVVADMQAPPMGGCASDYVQWALQVPGVTRAWVYPLASGAGTVTVRFVRDGDASLIPDAGEVAAVQAHIAALAPVTATVTVAAPTQLVVNPNIHLMPDTADGRAAVLAELADLFRRDAAPGARLYVSRFREAVSTAAGEVDNSVVSPTADVVPAAGQIPVLGTVTWS